jgi:hypothetical protein
MSASTPRENSVRVTRMMPLAAGMTGRSANRTAARK